MFQKRPGFQGAEDDQMTMIVTLQLQSTNASCKEAHGPLIISCPLAPKKKNFNQKPEQPGVGKRAGCLKDWNVRKTKETPASDKLRR